jgi:hypothetical protein
MKKIILLVTLITVIIGNAFQLYGQTLEEDKVDEFTNNSIKRTSWETLNMSMDFTAYYRISSINNQKYFDLKLMIGAKVFSINKDQELMFKLENGEFVKLPNLEYSITCTGCGAIGFSGSQAQGAKIMYPIDDAQFEMLKNNTVVKVRIYTSDGYVEDETKEKYAIKMQKAIKLVE